jgi:hypothetical protein
MVMVVQNGTANTGSGGGGGQTTNSATNGVRGGKGVVILRICLLHIFLVQQQVLQQNQMMEQLKD